MPAVSVIIAALDAHETLGAAIDTSGMTVEIRQLGSAGASPAATLTLPNWRKAP